MIHGCQAKQSFGFVAEIVASTQASVRVGCASIVDGAGQQCLKEQSFINHTTVVGCFDTMRRGDQIWRDDIPRKSNAI